MVRSLILTVLATGLSASHGFAQRQSPLEPGAKAPAWKALPGTDGKLHSLDDLAKSKVVVVSFTCNSCPYAKAYEERFIAFTRDYAEKGVAFVAINVNNEEADRLPKMKERSAERGFNFPYLHDASQEIGHAYGAVVTPHLYVLDEQRRVVYAGAFDDARTVERVKRHFVKDAVEAVLAKQKPAVARTTATGCRILYE